MDQYTDDERVEDLKKWWKENGVSIIGGIALGLVAIFGWQYWNSHRTAQAEAASRAYDIFVAAAEKSDAEQTRQRGQVLLTDFPHSAYAALTALRLAKLATDNGDTAAASQRLEWVIGNAQLDELKDIARLRLARVLSAAGRTEEAGKLLASVTTTTLMAERDELQGDLYLAGNDAAKARTAYAAALAASGGNPLLQLKLDNLAPPTAGSVVHRGQSVTGFFAELRVLQAKAPVGVLVGLTGMAGIIAQVKAEAGHDIPRVVDIVTGELVKPITDYRRSTRSFNRGVLLRFVLEAGRTYRVYAHTSWKGREEFQCQVSDEGEIIRLEK